MIVLRFSVLGEDVLSVLMACVMCLHSSMQEERYS
jgi:hypothetical protein